MTIEKRKIPGFDADAELGLLLLRTRRAMFKELERAFAPIGVSPEQIAVIDVATELEFATVSDIEKRILREPHTILGLINRMEAKGYINKGKDLKNKNTITIRLTKKGQILAGKIQIIRSNIKPFALLDDPEKAQLRDSLKKVLKHTLSTLGKSDPYEYKD